MFYCSSFFVQLMLFYFSVDSKQSVINANGKFCNLQIILPIFFEFWARRFILISYLVNCCSIITINCCSLKIMSRMVACGHLCARGGVLMRQSVVRFASRLPVVPPTAAPIVTNTDGKSTLAGGKWMLNTVVDPATNGGNGNGRGMKEMRINRREEMLVSLINFDRKSTR